MVHERSANSMVTTRSKDIQEIFKKTRATQHHYNLYHAQVLTYRQPIVQEHEASV